MGLLRSGRIKAGVILGAVVAAAPAQAVWEERFPTTSPGPLSYHAMVYDSARGRMVVFGGFNGQRLVADTWEWDGLVWSLRPTAVAPSPRWLLRLAYDSARGRTVLFGGDALSRNLGDTWEWDGTSWLERRPVHAPSVRHSCGMAYDAARSRVVLFGGYNLGVQGETWEWDGTDWTQRNVGLLAPEARAAHAMVYDAGRARVVLFGGNSDFGTYRLLDDTWEWDGTAWSKRTAPSGPSARRDHAMAYDSARGRTVLFGGNAGGSGLVVVGDTWEWDGTSWNSRTTTAAPTARHVHALAYDVARKRTVLHGGANFSVVFGDTWLYSAAPSATYFRFGAGCPGSAGTPVLDANGQKPWIGESFTLFLSNLPPGSSALIWLGRSRTAAGPIPLPFDLTPLGLTGCSLLVSPERDFPVFNFRGTATWTVSIPRDSSLLGEPFFNQALVVDAPANPFGAIVSNGGEGVFGGR